MTDHLGTVYWGTHQQNSYQAWVKCFHGPGTDQQVLQDRYLNAVQQLQSANAPCLLQFHDANIGMDGQVYCVTEAANGYSLEQLLLQNHAFPADQAARLMIQFLTAMGQLHQVSLLHGDIRSSMVFWNQDDASAEGIFKVHHPGHTWWWSDLLRQSGGPSHQSILYMAPEQQLGQGYDYRTDIYSCGVIFAELLLGRSLLASEPHRFTQVEWIGSNILEVLQENAHVPRSVLPVLSQALAYNQQQRYGSAEQFAQALRNILSSLNMGQYASSDYLMAQNMQPSHGSMDDLFGQSPQDATLVQGSDAQLAQEPYGMGSSGQWGAADEPAATVRAAGVSLEDYAKMAVEPHPGAYSSSGLPQSIAPPSIPPFPAEDEEDGEDDAPAMTPFRWLFLFVVLVGSIVAMVYLVDNNKKEAVAPTPKRLKIATLQLFTKPKGSSVWVDGKKHPFKTPTTVTGTIGKQYQILLRQKGYKPKIFVWVANRSGKETSSMEVDPSAAAAQKANTVGKGAPDKRAAAVKTRVAPRRRVFKAPRIPPPPPPPPPVRFKSRKRVSSGSVVLSITSTPPGATVQIGKRVFPRQTPVKAVLAKGKWHKVTLRKYGYQESYFFWHAKKSESKKVSLYRHSWYNP